MEPVRLFIPFSSKQYVMRFVSSGALELDASKYEVHFGATADCAELLGSELTARGIEPRERLHALPDTTESFEQWKEIFDSSCVRYRRLSPSFALRAESHRRLGALKYWKLRLWSLPGVYELRRERLRKFSRPNATLMAVLKQVKPDWVLLPSALLDRLTEEVLLAARRSGIRSLLLSSNWDNLSSKGMLTFQPDFLACWGEQTRAHARDIQRVPIERTFALGGPHFESLLLARQTSREESRRQLGLDPHERMILFAGSFREIDETAMLRDLEKAIDDGVIPRATILYRPHPWRMERDEAHFDSIVWRHVKLDPGMSEAYRRMKHAKAAADSSFDIGHLGCLYRAADALISPMSTALLEALHFEVPILALNFGDGKHYWSPDKAGAMLHFNEFYELPGVAVIRDRAQLISETARLLEIDRVAFARELSERLEFFVKTTPGTYATRLDQLMDHLHPVPAQPAYV